MALKEPDRRLRARYRVRLPFTLNIENQEPIHGLTRNISLLGISAYAQQPAQQVKPIETILELPNGNPSVSVTGTVIRCQPLEQPNPDGPYEIGIFFKAFREDGEARLSDYLAKVSSDEKAEILAGYRELKQRMAARKKKKQLELRRKKQRKLKRLAVKKKKEVLAKKKKAAKARKKAAKRTTSSAKKRTKKS